MVVWESPSFCPDSDRRDLRPMLRAPSKYGNARKLQIPRAAKTLPKRHKLDLA